MVIVINSVIGEFSWVDLIWVAALTADYKSPIKANCPSSLSDENSTE